MCTPDIDEFLENLLTNLDNDLSAFVIYLQEDTDEILENVLANLDSEIETMMKMIS